MVADGLIVRRRLDWRRLRRPKSQHSRLIAIFMLLRYIIWRGL